MAIPASISSSPVSQRVDLLQASPLEREELGFVGQQKRTREEAEQAARLQHSSFLGSFHPCSKVKLLSFVGKDVLKVFITNKLNAPKP